MKTPALNSDARATIKAHVYTALNNAFDTFKQNPAALHWVALEHAMLVFQALNKGGARAEVCYRAAFPAPWSNIVMEAHKALTAYDAKMERS